MCRLSWNLGASTSWNPPGLYKDCFTFYLTVVEICQSFGRNPCLNLQGIKISLKGNTGQLQGEWWQLQGEGWQLQGEGWHNWWWRRRLSGRGRCWQIIDKNGGKTDENKRDCCTKTKGALRVSTRLYDSTPKVKQLAESVYQTIRQHIQSQTISWPIQQAADQTSTATSHITNLTNHTTSCTGAIPVEG